MFKVAVKLVEIAAAFGLLGRFSVAGMLAKVFSYLLGRAMRTGTWAAVRLTARRVIEQCNYVLDVTEDGVVGEEEIAGAVGKARELLEAWAAGKGKGVTRAIEAELRDAVKEARDDKAEA